jgi:glyoxylase-like metal-dependent hydrolase (beta-lactamase superfamily II)
MTVWLCATCGLEHADTERPPESCAICSDDRQYIPRTGQRWTTLPEVQVDRHAQISEMEPDLYGIAITPKVGIGHRPLLIRTPSGNLLWDPPGFVDDVLVTEIKRLGGIAAIASSHPHLTGVSVTISHLFGSVPVWYNADDQRWIRRPDEVIRLWRDHQDVLPGLTVVQCGGHFPGSAVLHWPAGANGRGAIMTGDTIRPNADWHTVSFMRSYPNLIPLPPRSVQKIAAAIAPLAFDRIYGGFEGELIDTNGADAVQSSARRYIEWVTDQVQDLDERV